MRRRRRIREPIITMYMAAPVDWDDWDNEYYTITTTTPVKEDPEPEEMRRICLEDAFLRDLLERVRRLEDYREAAVRPVILALKEANDLAHEDLREHIRDQAEELDRLRARVEDLETRLDEVNG